MIHVCRHCLPRRMFELTATEQQHGRRAAGPDPSESGRENLRQDEKRQRITGQTPRKTPTHDLYPQPQSLSKWPNSTYLANPFFKLNTVGVLVALDQSYT